jgi:hypothetical protein
MFLYESKTNLANRRVSPNDLVDRSYRLNVATMAARWRRDHGNVIVAVVTSDY